MAKTNNVSFLTDICEDITSGIKLDILLDKILSKVLNYTKTSVGMILVTGQKKDRLEIKSSRGLPKGKQKTVPLGEGINGIVIKEGKPIMIANCKQDSLFKKTEELASSKVNNLIAMPLKIRNKTFGVLTLANEEKNNPFSEATIDLLSIIAGFISITLENSKLFQKIEEISTLDEYTHLYNMRFFRKLLDRELHRAERYKNKMSLILLDLDYLKDINDTHGYLMGNQALKEIADLLKDNVRKVDEISRYGGDEFIVLLPETDYHQAFFSAERIRAKIEEHVFLTGCGLKLKITVSIGLASYPQHASGKDELIRQANNAMYKAKEKGRNIVLIAG